VQGEQYNGTYFGAMPDPYIPNEDKGLDYHRRCIYAVANQYCQSELNVFTNQGIEINNNLDYSRFNGNSYYLQLYAYIFGEQNNIAYQFMTELPETGVTKPAVWIPGKQIRYFVDKLKGQYMEKMRSAQITTRTINPNTVSGREKIKKKLETYLDFKIEFDQLITDAGMKPEQVLDYLPQSKEDIEEYIDNLNALLEKTYGTISRSIYYQTGFVNNLIPAMVDVIVTGYCGFKLRIINKKVVPEYCFAPTLFFDRDTDGDYRENMRFAGRYSYLTLPEIQERFNISNAELIYIKEHCKQTSYWGGYGMPQEAIASFAGMNRVFPIYLNRSSIPTYLVLETEWQDVSKISYTYSTLKNGVELCEPTEEVEKMSKQQLARRKNQRVETKYPKVWRQGVMIGGYVCVDYGIRPFQAHSTYGTYKTPCSYFIFTPDMKFGFASSTVRAAKELQDDISLYTYKIQHIVQADKGVLLALNNTFIGTSAVKFLEQIQSNGVAELDYSMLGNDDIAKMLLGVPVFHKEDLSLNAAGVAQYMQMIAFKMTQLEQIFHLPPVSQGRETGIDNKSVQTQAVELANIGISPLYIRFDNYINIIMQYATNVQKDIYAMLNDGGEEIILLEKDEVTAIKMTQDMYYDDVLVAVKFDDPISKDLKEKTFQIMFAKIQNGDTSISLVDSIKIMSSNSVGEMETVARKADIKAKRTQEQNQAMAQQQQQIDMAQQQQLAQQQSQTQLGAVGMQEQQKNIRQDKELEMQNKQLAFQATDKIATLEDNEKDREHKLELEKSKKING